MDAKEQLADIHRLLGLQYRPGEYAVYKPRKGAGSALRLNLRLEPEFAEGYVREVAGGLFLTLAPEGPEENGYPTFFKHQQERHITAKLGMADITGQLAAIREWRAGRAVPVGVRKGKRREDKAAAPDNEYSNFHQTPDGSNTAIGITFNDDGSVLRLSKGGATEQKGQYLTVTLSVMEELAYVAYLELALAKFLELGVR